jgi:hypothetical protein
MKRITRREFLKISGAGATGVALLGAGCSPQPASPTTVPADMAAVTSTVAPLPSTSLAGKVVQARHAGVWQAGKLDPDLLGRMLDAGILKLTGIDQARQAWAALFRPDERIGIKVNSFYNSVIWTHVPLVTAVADRLQAAGIPAEQITVFDNTSDELTTAGFAINRDSTGIRCYGTDGKFNTSVSIANRDIRLSDILLNVDAVINMPVLKTHMLAGLTFALKNHYGSIHQPGALHATATCIPALNAVPAIKDRTRLIIGDMLEACLEYGYSWPYWKADFTGDSILLSTDPVAHDAIGLQRIVGYMEEKDITASFVQGMAAPWLEGAASLGLGVADTGKIQFLEANLG